MKGSMGQLIIGSFVFGIDLFIIFFRGKHWKKTHQDHIAMQWSQRVTFEIFGKEGQQLKSYALLPDACDAILSKLLCLLGAVQN